MLRARGATDKGPIRPTNEDAFVVVEHLGLCVVADGIGGHQAGEVAARLAVDAVVDFVAEAWSRRDLARPSSDPFGVDPSLTEAGNVLRTAIHLANTQVLEAAATSKALAGMGTTIVAALAVGNCVAVGHVGDSRLYLSAGGRLQQLTSDDSWTARVLAHDPAVDAAALRRHPLRHALTNVVGASPATDVHVTEQRLKGGEVLLLCTDGVHAVLDEHRLQELVGGVGDPGRIAARLVEAAIEGGSRDNCTAIVAQYFPGS